MFLLNTLPEHRRPLDPADATTLGVAGAEEAERFLLARRNHFETPLHTLPAMAAELGVGSLHVKDEGFRLGLGSFKALGGSYAVIRLVLEAAQKRLGRRIDIGELHAPEVAAVAAGMTFACATDGNHGRSVAQAKVMPAATAATSGACNSPMSMRRPSLFCAASSTSRMTA